MENIIENNENTDNNSDVGKIIKPIQQQQPETENNLQMQQQQQQPPPPQQDVQQQLQLQEQVGIAKQNETPGEKTLEQQPLLPEEFEGEDDDEEDDDDDDEEKETSQKLIIDIPDEEEEDEDEDDDVIALDDLPTEAVSAPKENAENAKNNIKKPVEAEAIITLSDGEEDIPANEVVSKPGKVQKRRSVGSNAAAGNDEERFRLKRRKINVEGAPKMPLTGYVRYMNDRRESLRKEYPTKTSMEHTKIIGEEWHSLPADVKASYLKAADADKQRYVKELDIFLKSRPDVLASELAKNKARKSIENNSPNLSTIIATATTTATTTAAGLTTNKQQQQQQQQQQQVLKDKSQTTDNATKSIKDGITKEKTGTKEMVAPMPSTSQQALDNHKTTQEKNKRKRTPTPPTTANTTTTTPAMATNTNAAAASTSNAIGTNATNAAAAAGTTSAIVTPAAAGEIPIFTNEFLEHNKVYDMELRSLRKSKTDLEQQNSVLEKHVENMKFGVEKMITENNELEEKNRLLEIYLDKLKRKLALALATLPLPSAPNGATVDNIDKYMQDLYKMSTSNSHGPATLNKAKDIIRKLDLQIQL